MIIYSIYRATNRNNGKQYVGFAKNFAYRKRSHLRDSFNPNSTNYNTAFHQAIRKHGIDAFEWEVLYQSLDGHHTLAVMENHFIVESGSFQKGYNQTLGGEGTLGRGCSLETKAKIKFKRQFQVFSEATREAMSKASKGRPKSQAMRNKLKGNKNAVKKITMSSSSS